MSVKVLNYQLSVGKWADKGGGMSETFILEAEQGLNGWLSHLTEMGCEIVDIKVNHYTVNRHNNGGYDEIWVQYTILYH